MSEFDEVGRFIAIPRVTSLALSPDGQWLAATVASMSPDKKKYVSSIWRLDVGPAAPVRLTRSAQGEADPAFLPDGSLLFVSARPDPMAKPADDADGDKPALWSLPPGGGEARRLTTTPGGVVKVVTAREAASYLIAAPAFSGTADLEADAARRKARADAGVSAILHEGEFVRFWDTDLGPDCLRLMAGEASVSDAETGADAAAPRDLTPDPGRALDDQQFGLSPDGSVAVSGWQVRQAGGAVRNEVAAIEVATGTHRTLMAADDLDFAQPVISPDGQYVAAIRAEHDTYERGGDFTLVLAPLADGAQTAPAAPAAPAAPRDLLPDFDRRPGEFAWSPDSTTIYFTADDNGRCPVFAVDVATGKVRQVTTDDAAYDSLCAAPDGLAMYALRSAIGEAPAPVRIDLAGEGASPVRLASPTPALEVPGHVREVSATVSDGSTVRGWLALPDGASAQHKAPLLLWVHGGPYSSWNSWSWRWNPWLMVARGYAVLLPDPALSTGYGRDFIDRGWSGWGGTPFTDIMMITDVVTALPEIDSARTAMMGGSFGGYMANWIAGHTDRFAGIVSHAGLWALDQMLGTTDAPYWLRLELGDPQTQPTRYVENSPHLHATAISTPILIIHGDKDYRVPIGEALRMYSDLISLGKKVRFLYFPDENHWILKPGDVTVWYETVFAFLAENVLGQEWQRPELL
ncbi:MAG TPA: S9 family peptidase [Streptosporangiaceae bacterium]|nr:S9 family peptidase [Streptosporangiaceae bacterium]